MIFFSVSVDTRKKLYENILWSEEIERIVALAVESDLTQNRFE